MGVYNNGKDSIYSCLLPIIARATLPYIVWEGKDVVKG